LKQNQDSYVLKNLEKKQTKQIKSAERNKQTKQEKIQNCFHLIVNQETKMT